MDSPPRPLPTGTETYYLLRRDDFLLRQPDTEPPSYYVRYGNKCLHQFLAIEPKLTEDGQGWLRRTLRILQELMERELARDPERFAALELDDERFEDFAFSTHSTAYLQAGLLELPLDDLLKIAVTPDVRDLLRPDGIVQIVDLLEEVSLHDVATILRRTVDRG